jgi:manganese/iron transport system permease protein
MFETALILRETILAAVFAGISCSLVGVFIFCLRIPFVGVLISHAAMAGAILAQFLHWPELPAAMGMALLSVFFVGPLADRTEMDVNVSLSILFSLMMGIAFLGIGLIPEPKTPMLGLLWGNILLVTGRDVLAMGVVTLLVLACLKAGYKELKTVLFSRTVAAAVGIRDDLFFYALLVLSGAVVSVNLSSIGGLMLYSLLINPAAGAYQLAYRLRSMIVIAVLLGLGAALLGLLCSYIWALPTGASIVICSSLEFATCALFSPKRGRFRKEREAS